MKSKIKSSKLKVVVIVGPTASGKSELAVKLAKKFNGEIISADSRQIYRGLDIGTGKVLGNWISKNVATNKRSRDSCNIFMYKGIPHYCIDFVSPKRIFTAAEYKKYAEAAIKDITSRGKLPIIVGGTGFWIDAVVYDIGFPKVPPNSKLRRRLEKKSAAELLRILQKLDQKYAKTIEQKNPRRLIRAIEIAKTLGKVPKLKKRSPYNALWIGLNPSYESYETWSHKVIRRVKNMVKAGLVRETKKLLRRGVSRKRIKEFGFEYRATLDFIDKKMSREEFLERMVRCTLRYARSQAMWWKRNLNIKWVSGSHVTKTLVRRFLKSGQR